VETLDGVDFRAISISSIQPNQNHIMGDNVLESYASLLHHFDSLLGSCSEVLNNYSHQQTPENGAAAEKCLLNRQKRIGQVTSSCQNLYTNYEKCMATTPDECVQPLASLFQCARETLALDE
jgi:hypothetical protein